MTRPPMTDTMVKLPVIDLVHPLPGFPDQRRFALVQIDDEGLLCQLRSLDDPNLRFLVMPPTPFFPGYAPEVSADVVADLQIDSAEDVLVLLVLNAGESLHSTTANLMAPVLINTATLRASQVILDDPGLSIAAPLVA